MRCCAYRTTRIRCNQTSQSLSAASVSQRHERGTERVEAWSVRESKGSTSFTAVSCRLLTEYSLPTLTHTVPCISDMKLYVCVCVCMYTCYHSLWGGVNLRPPWLWVLCHRSWPHPLEPAPSQHCCLLPCARLSQTSLLVSERSELAAEACERSVGEQICINICVWQEYSSLNFASD